MRNNVLAENPLDLVMGFGRPKAAPPASAIPGPEGRGEPAKTETPSNVVAIAPEHAQAKSEHAPVAVVATIAMPEVVQAKAESAPVARAARPKKPPARRIETPLAEESASLKHRIGTMKAPYQRTDGMLVRQWSITLPVDVIRRMNHLAIDRGVKPAELALQAIEEFLDANASAG